MNAEAGLYVAVKLDYVNGYETNDYSQPVSLYDEVESAVGDGYEVVGHVIKAGQDYIESGDTDFEVSRQDRGEGTFDGVDVEIDEAPVPNELPDDYSPMLAGRMMMVEPPDDVPTTPTTPTTPSGSPTSPTSPDVATESPTSPVEEPTSPTESPTTPLTLEEVFDDGPPHEPLPPPVPPVGPDGPPDLSELFDKPTDLDDV